MTTETTTQQPDFIQTVVDEVWETAKKKVLEELRLTLERKVKKI